MIKRRPNPDKRSEAGRDLRARVYLNKYIYNTIHIFP